jgi:putative redox protein
MSDHVARAAIARTEPGTFVTDVRVRGHTFVSDEPASSGGTDLGPTPAELVAAALAACTTITLRMYADRKAWPLEAVEASVERLVESSASLAGSRAAPRYLRRLTLMGPLDEAQIARLVQIADRCPVHRQLAGGTTIVTELAP